MDAIGLIFVMTFYLAILICGIWVARRKNSMSDHAMEKVKAYEFLLANILCHHKIKLIEKIKISNF